MMRKYFFIMWNLTIGQQMTASVTLQGSQCWVSSLQFENVVHQIFLLNRKSARPTSAKFCSNGTRLLMNQEMLLLQSPWAAASRKQSQIYLLPRLLLLEAARPSAAAINNLLRVRRQRLPGFNVKYGRIINNASLRRAVVATR